MTRPVVGRELRGQAVERVRDAGADRHEDARRVSERERDERERRQHAERDPEARALGVRGLVRRRGEREQRDAARDRDHGELLAGADPLAEPRGDRQQEDEAHAEQRLDERQRGLRQRVGLEHPAGEAERRPRDPAGPSNEPPEEPEAQRVLGRLVARAERLQADPDRVERGGAERRDDAEQEVHGRQGR